MNVGENVKLIYEDWKYPGVDGMPDDGDLCIVIWECQDGELDVFVGGYFPEERKFWNDWGLGGAVLDETDVVCWKLLNDFKVN